MPFRRIRQSLYLLSGLKNLQRELNKHARCTGVRLWAIHRREVLKKLIPLALDFQNLM
jgi:hypothetical protein